MKPLRAILAKPFAPWLGDDDWTPWLAFASALRGEPMSDAEFELFKACTGRTVAPTKPSNEAWVVVGRRGRKSSVAAMLAVYFALYGEWKRAPGETVRVMIVALSKDQAGIILSYVLALLASRPAFASRVDYKDDNSVMLTNGIEIKCVANNFRSIRGPTVVCAIFEELAFWYDDSGTYANPDKEIMRAVRPSMATVPGALLLGISSPYAKRGLLYEKYRDHYGKDGRILVWQAATQVMNPQVDREFLAEEYANDPVAAEAEYGAMFRQDVSSFIDRDTVQRCVDSGVYEREPSPSIVYSAFCDPAGGTGQDSMTLAIAHKESDGCRILDCVREVRPPFSPAATVKDFAAVLKTYRISRLTGDHWGGGFVREPFKLAGINYEVCDQSKSTLYQDALPLLNSARARLLDSQRLVSQICGLDRRVARGGHESIDHAPHQHDDLSNSALGVLARLDSLSVYTSALNNAIPTEQRWNNASRLAGIAPVNPLRRLS